MHTIFLYSSIRGVIRTVRNKTLTCSRVLKIYKYHLQDFYKTFTTEKVTFTRCDPYKLDRSRSGKGDL